MTKTGRSTKAKILTALGVAAGLLVLVLANAHLVYVATRSQPDCVAHLKARGDSAGLFRAAQSAC